MVTQGKLALEVRRGDAQRALETLLARGLLDDSRGIVRRRTTVLFPVRELAEGELVSGSMGRLVRARLPARSRGPPIERIRRDSGLPAPLAALLPRRWQRSGDVLLLRLPEELKAHSAAVGRAYASALKARSVVDVERVGGEFREPEARLIHGETAETVHRENGVSFALDATRLMFSKGNKLERQRTSRAVRDGDVVVDMFAGIGYFTLPIASRAHPRKIIAVEKNPLAFSYLKRNIELNRKSGVVEALNADCREVELLAAGGGPADLVVMGYIPEAGESREGLAGAWEFLPAASRVLRKGGKALFHALAPARARHRVSPDGFGLVGSRRVKSYGPRTDHVVLELVKR
jgi:tRNA wybutosine-synthesizing protein 2